MFNRKELSPLVVVAALATSLPVFAQTSSQSQEPPIAPEASTPAPATAPATSAAPSRNIQQSKEAARIAEINERIAVMSAQLAELEMRAKIASKQTEIEKAREASLGLSMYDNFIPSVREINGIDGRIWAVLNVAGGNTQIVRVGDSVGPWLVTQILPDSVTVKRGKDTIRLSFGLGVPQTPFGDGAAQYMLPPPPQIGGGATQNTLPPVFR